MAPSLQLSLGRSLNPESSDTGGLVGPDWSADALSTRKLQMLRRAAATRIVDVLGDPNTPRVPPRAPPAPPIPPPSLPTPAYPPDWPPPPPPSPPAPPFPPPPPPSPPPPSVAAVELAWKVAVLGPATLLAWGGAAYVLSRCGRLCAGSSHLKHRQLGDDADGAPAALAYRSTSIRNHQPKRGSSLALGLGREVSRGL